MKSIWSELRSDFEDDDIIYIDAWLSEDDMEDGKTIAKVNVLTGEVDYLDNRAKKNKEAQELIKEAINSKVIGKIQCMINSDYQFTKSQLETVLNLLEYYDLHNKTLLKNKS